MSIELNAYWNASPQKKSPGTSATPRSSRGVAVVSDDGGVDPVEDLPEPGRPHDVGDLTRSPVDHRQPVAHLLDAGGDALDAACGEVRRLDPQRRAAVVTHVRHHPAPEWGAAGEHVAPREEQDREEGVHRAGLEPGRDRAAVATGEDGRVGGCHLEGDVRPGVARPDDEHRAGVQLPGPAVLARVELEDRRVELCGDGRDVGGAAERARGDDHVVAEVAAAVGREDVAAPGAAEALHPGVQHDRHVEPAGVVLQVGGDVLLAREGPPRRGEGRPGQAVVLRGGVEGEGVPLAPPLVPDAAAGLEDDERAAALAQVVPGRQPRLSGADDDGFDVGGVHVPTLGAGRGAPRRADRPSCAEAGVGTPTHVRRARGARG